MGTNSKIEWCQHTWSPWYCCTRVSEGCANCYMERWAKRAGRDAFGGPIPAKNRMHFPRSKHHKKGDFVFVCSLSDFFHDEAPDQWRADALAEMARRPELVFLLLTKRIDVAKRFVEEEVMARVPEEWEILQREQNVWLGVTAENQARADERVPKLIELDWPGKKFVSIEPMIGPVDLRRWLRVYSHKGPPCCEDQEGYHPLGHDLPNRPSPLLSWAIVGGESGANARPMDANWARAVRDQCQSAGVPFFFKQWGEWLPICQDWKLQDDAETHRMASAPIGRWHAGTDSLRVGKDRTGKRLDGAQHLERPDSERT